MTQYEQWLHETWNNPNCDVFQFCLDGMNEEHGEINGVIKRMRRGDYGVSVQNSIVRVGLQNTLMAFPRCKDDLLQEIGDYHCYTTKFLSMLNLTIHDAENRNVIKYELKHPPKHTTINTGNKREDYSPINYEEVRAEKMEEDLYNAFTEGGTS